MEEGGGHYAFLRFSGAPGLNLRHLRGPVRLSLTATQPLCAQAGRHRQSAQSHEHCLMEPLAAYLASSGSYSHTVER
jgi:hypothetical protein